MDQPFTAAGEGGSLTVTPTTVTVHSGARERAIPLQQVATVTLQHPGLGTGYLHLVLYNDPHPERVLAEWVADGEAVVIRAADYPAFATARDLIERYRAALPPEPPSTE
ncbi:MAG TPA: hypothetical protein VFN57_15685, partial [Thermomicrobiaceae bacterium]|nr:hypothetical protein [Thermomicrobiaceae bacterium]